MQILKCHPVFFEHLLHNPIMAALQVNRAGPAVESARRLGISTRHVLLLHVVSTYLARVFPNPRVKNRLLLAIDANVL